jgi:hypothetical protein
MLPPLRNTKLLFTELAIVFGFVTVMIHWFAGPNYVVHLHQIFLNYYQDGTVDFSVNVTGLVRSLGVVDLLTLTFGLALGAALALTLKSPDSVQGANNDTRHLNEYDRALSNSGFVRITRRQSGTTYQVTELGRRFLLENADLQHKLQEEKSFVP